MQQIRQKRFGGEHFKKVKMCMFTGDTKKATKSFTEFKKENDIKIKIQSKTKAPWQSHNTFAKSEDFEKFLGFNREEYKIF